VVVYVFPDYQGRINNAGRALLWIYASGNPVGAFIGYSFLARYGVRTLVESSVLPRKSYESS
jgi:hypothetical protein